MPAGLEPHGPLVPDSKTEGTLPGCRPLLGLARAGCASSELLLGSFPMCSYPVCANNPQCIPPAQMLVPNAGHHLQDIYQTLTNSQKHCQEAGLIIMPALQVEGQHLEKWNSLVTQGQLVTEPEIEPRADSAPLIRTDSHPGGLPHS